ncbi:phage tail protein [Methylorubrum sp. SB2]|uniref:phage tail protein n=1 Tax=Methylorubrum subtropicum TaxID=3138812 RepID=UPI00313C9888
MEDCYIGEVRLVAFPFQPRNFLFCNGQLLPISNYTPLYAVLGTTYGGNGTTNFALPNLQSRVVVNQGTGPGLSQYPIGQAGGAESVTLLPSQMPLHTHPYAMQVDGSPGSTDDPTNAHIAQVTNPGSGSPLQSFTNVAMNNPVNLAGQNTGPNQGGGQPHTNIQPYLAMNYIICFMGIFPSRA